MRSGKTDGGLGWVVEQRRMLVKDEEVTNRCRWCGRHKKVLKDLAKSDYREWRIYLCMYVYIHTHRIKTFLS